jgi:hypothetical protein
MRNKSTAKKSLCQVLPQSPENDAPEKYLTQAVQQLIAAAETPSNLLQFLTDALWIIHENEGEGKAIDPEKSAHYSVLGMVEYLATPWFENLKPTAGVMEAALSKLVFEIGDEGFHDACGALLIAYGLDYETGYTPLPVLKQRLGILNALCLMVPYVREYEHAKGRQRNNEAAAT